MMQRLCLLGLSLLAVGCGSSTRSYSVSVKNDSLEPMTVWLTKDGPPVEQNWLAPEQIAQAGAYNREFPLAGVVIPPGRSGEMGPLQGSFDHGSNAVLRIYRGPLKFNEILATGSDSPNRTDVKLAPGDNQIVIDRSGKPTQR
jgi:hypothetical protein